jgi:hypothetical protein
VAAYCIVGVVGGFDAGSDTIDVWPLYGLATGNSSFRSLSNGECRGRSHGEEQAPLLCSSERSSCGCGRRVFQTFFSSTKIAEYVA